MQITQNLDRKYIATDSNIEERKQANRDGTPEPEPLNARVTVVVSHETDDANAAEMLRQLADHIEGEGVGFRCDDPASLTDHTPLSR